MLTVTENTPGRQPGASSTPTAGGGGRISSGTSWSRRRPDWSGARIDFLALHQHALPHLLDLLGQWLPDGKRRGREYVACNPRRQDRHVGSFSINIHTGAWADFATGDRGRDIVSLVAFLYAVRPGQAARILADAIGVAVPRG